ncbi:MAG: TonB-dependent receptor, partial [Phaeodactylibacter sp.]|nr:TonB-dependent receptor [Phaeodactylibacter sp.]
SNFNKGETSSFFYWQNSTTGAMKMNRDNAAVSRTLFFRYYIDPLVTYYDPVGNRHKFIGRYFNVQNDVNNNQGNASQLRYGEYQFQHNFEEINLVATAGALIINTSIEAQLYGDTLYNSVNQAAYAQLDKKLFDRLNLSAGFRYESNRIDNPGFQWDSIGIFNDTTVITVLPSTDKEAKPVFRFGANLEMAEATFLRASWGQGYRFPTIAEKYIFTDIGGAVVTPNPELTSETGWSAEIGLKQGYAIGNFNGFVDIAGFWSEYQNMLEFSISSVLPTLFQSQNVGGTIIKGGEVTIAGSGELFGLPTTFLAGYTYIDPKFAQFDTIPPTTLRGATEGQTNALFSSSNDNILKYRSRHTAKLDIQSKFKNWSAGIALFYASHQEAVDAVFESIVIKGLREYREAHGKGYAIANVRVGYHFDEQKRITLLVKNILNTEYTVRPGLIEAPRNITLRLDYGF